MEGYRPETYGERIADVYDDWFSGPTDVVATVRFLHEVAGSKVAAVLELAAGTGRLTIPLAAYGHNVVGIDISEEMLCCLRRADVDQRVNAVRGDMVDDLPPGPFDLIFVAYNSLFMLNEPSRQRACFAAVAARLSPGGAFVVEAFVPDERASRGAEITLRSMTADRVVLAVNQYDTEAQTVMTQLVELTDHEPVKLRPLHLRYSHPAELDGWAAAAGLQLSERYGDVGRGEFTDESPFHVSVYRRT